MFFFVAYSPQKTPPKTPETPHFHHAPFAPPGAGNVVVNSNPVWPTQSFEMNEISPIATSETKADEGGFQLENMEGSPGNTLRERNRRINSPPTSPIQDEDDPTPIEMLQNSPGNRQRRSQDTQQPRVSIY